MKKKKKEEQEEFLAELTEPEQLKELPVLPENRALSSQQSFIPEDALLEHNLSQEVESDNNIKSMGKELFSSKDVDLKTEVSHNEINHLVRLQFLDSRFNIDNVGVLSKTFMRLRVSLERKSRREFVETVQLENRNAQGGNFFTRLFGGGGGNTP